MKYSVITLTYNQVDFLKEKVKPAWDNQTYHDFEWILANDGSTDDTAKWARENDIKIVSKKKNTGFDLVGMLNKVAKVSAGEYFVWVMGDSYPKHDFLEQLDQVVGRYRLVNGIRENVDKKGAFVSEDWRVGRVPFSTKGSTSIRISHLNPWVSMTLNSMCMSKLAFEKMGGIDTGYKGYGQMDWDMAAWAHFSGMGLYWAPRAIVYHLDHSNREDTLDNQKRFEKRLKSFSEKGYYL